MEQEIIYGANHHDAEIGVAVYEETGKEFEKGCEINRALLMKILDDNKDTEYGKKYDFAGIKSVEDYQKKVPVVVYDNIAPYLERMSDGEKDVLTAYSFSHMNETASTMGLPKRIPMTDEQAAVFLKYNKQYMDGLKGKHIDKKWEKGRAFCPTEGKHITLSSGITLGSASSVMAEYLRGGKETMGNMMGALFTSPVEATLPAKGTDTKYIHARFALMDENVTGIVCGFYSLIVNYLKYIADNHEMLINDIEKGTIDESIKLPDDVRKSLLSKIEPMPERAGRLKEVFKDGADLCFVPLIWPNITYIAGAGGDGFSIYDRIIKERYTGDTVKNIYYGVTASEGLWSVPGGVDTEDSVLAPGSVFFEFHPVDSDDYEDCITMDKVKEGEVYELIITNLSGFYRYRTADAVMITGFRGDTPTIKFMYRVNRTINMVAEKVSEKAMQIAVCNAMDELGVELSDYCVYPDYENLTYEFLVEPMKENTGVSETVLADAIYRHLCVTRAKFSSFVDAGKLKKPVAHWLQPETARLYHEMMVYRGAPANQTKPVRIIMNEKQRTFFYGLIMKK